MNKLRVMNLNVGDMVTVLCNSELLETEIADKNGIVVLRFNEEIEINEIDSIDIVIYGKKKSKKKEQ